MAKVVWLVPLALAGAMMVGCSDTSDPGELPPPPKTYTEQEIAAMPPQVQARVRQQQEYAKGMAQSAKPKGVESK